MKTENRVGVCLLISVSVLLAVDVIFTATAAPVAKQTQNDRIAEACIPSEGERRVIEWQVDEAGNKSLVVSTQKFLGTRKGTAQYAILETSEVQ